MKTTLALLALLSLAGCAPDVEKRQYPTPQTEFGPIQKDADLGLEALTVEQRAVVSSEKLAWSGAVDSARVFRLGETLNTLGTLKNSPELAKLGKRVGQSFYAAQGTSTQNSFQDSLYILAAAGETKKDSLATIKEVDDMLAKELPRIDGILDSLARRTDWPKPGASTSEMLKVANEFGARFLRHVGREEIHPQIREAIEEAFKTDFFPLLEGMDRDLESILSDPRSVNIIRRLREFISKQGFSLSPETADLLSKAEKVMLHIEAMEKRHDVLTVIVELWEMTGPESREETFKPVSEDLYGYLKNKGPKNLRCIKNPKCLNPIVWLPKKLVILPAIEKFGLEEIRKDIADASREALITQVRAEVAEIIPSIPQEISLRLGAEIGGIRGKLRTIRSDYTGFLKKVASEYAQDELRASGNSVAKIQGVEAQRVNVQISTSAVAMKSEAVMSGVASGAEVIGASMAYATTSWERDAKSDPLAYQKSVISQINKMLAIGGFKNTEGARFKSLSLSLNPEAKQRHFYIRDFMDASTGYAVPDQMLVRSTLTSEPNDGGMNVSVRGQGELLRGFSAMIRYFRDWEKNAFDETLGTIEVGKLIKDLPAEGLHQKLFPKDMFFSIAVGNGAAILQNLTKALSPVFLIDLNNQTSWSDVRDPENETPSTMAAVVDIKMGKRTETVKTADAARFLLAIADFLDATEGIENTRSSPLLEVGSDGRTSIEQLIDAKRELRLLIVGIANFLSHQMADKDGGVRGSFSQTLVSVKAGEARSLNDQVLTILALERASSALGKDIYAWAALDTFAFMNKTLWNKKTGFYRSREGSEEKPSIDEVVETILAGERLKSRMTAKSQSQWQLISQPWLRALEQL